MLRKLTLEVSPSVESNDHQVRIFVDGKDWFEFEYLGIDPPRFFEQTTFLGGALIVGRCLCGVEGCADIWANVKEQNGLVEWEFEHRASLKFSKEGYVSAIERAKNDHTWEDIKRTAERLVSVEFKNTSIESLSFEWASARIEEKKIHLSFCRKGGQEGYVQKMLALAGTALTPTMLLKMGNALSPAIHISWKMEIG